MYILVFWWRSRSSRYQFSYVRTKAVANTSRKKHCTIESTWRHPAARRRIFRGWLYVISQKSILKTFAIVRVTWSAPAMFFMSASCRLRDLFRRLQHESGATAVAVRHGASVAIASISPFRGIPTISCVQFAVLLSYYNFAISQFCIIPTPAARHRQQQRNRSRHSQIQVIEVSHVSVSGQEPVWQESSLCFVCGLFLCVWQILIYDIILFKYSILITSTTQHNACMHFFITNFINYLLFNKNKNEQTTLFIL